MEFLHRLFSGYFKLGTKFQIMSDLHLEVGQHYADFDIPAAAPYLVLAGDIGRLKDYQPYLDFLRRQCMHFIKVFLVLGNHEFLGVSHAEGLRLARGLEMEPGCHGNLHLMHRNRVDVGLSLGITILGCTLQSKIPSDAKFIVQMKVNDFKHIKSWTVDDHNLEHQQDVQWLRHEIQTIRSERSQLKRNILIITHHAPTIQGSSKPSDLSNPWSCAFSTDLLEDKALTEVQWWVFGHTHFTSEFKKGQVRLVSKQRGYVLNGVGLQTESSRPNIGSLLAQFAKIRETNQKEFDVSKVIKI